MRITSLWKPVVLVLSVVVLFGCAAHQIYRPDLAMCVSAQPQTECKTHALQEYQPPNGQNGAYLLGFIEFDDQGQLWDRRQMRAVLDALYTAEAPEEQNLLIVAFVHGWKHSAAPGDGNIATFREVLKHLSASEASISRIEGRPPRRVAGVYLGWRGGSITMPVLKELTFWDRKNTAHKVGHGGMTEVLSRLDLVRQTKDAVSPGGHGSTRLVVVGHSFGGAVVFSALSQILEGRFVHTVGPKGTVSDVEGFGDLVVLINPAFQAELFAPLSDMSTERGTYFKSQLPVLAILTSEADDATKIAFPIGRRLSTLFENERTSQRHNGVTGKTEDIDQGQSNVTAVGHFEPYRTHYLLATPQGQDKAPAMLSRDQSARLFFAASERWENDAPGSHIPFAGAVLERTDRSAGRDPYLVVRVDKRIIKDHNDIADPRLIEFLNQLILISSQSHEPKERSLLRQKGLAQ